MGGCCGGNAAAVLAAKMAVNAMPSDINSYAGDPVAGLVLMNYLGKNTGSYTFNGNGGRTYQGGDNEIQRQVWAHPDDVQMLLRTSKWVIAPEPPKPEAKAPEDEKPIEIVAAETQAAPVVEAVAVVEAAPVIEAQAAIEAVPDTRKRRGKK